MSHFHTLQHRATLAEGVKSLKEAKAKLSGPPVSYDSNAYYRVHLSQAVQLPGGSWMRPSDDVIIKGEVASNFAAFIVSAQEVAGPR